MSKISNLEKYNLDLEKLIDKGDWLCNAIYYEIKNDDDAYKTALGEKYDGFKKKLPKFAEGYQSYYSEAKVLIKLLLPDRLADFVRLYEKPKTRKDITYENYVIEDYLQKLSVTRGWEKNKVVGPDAAVPKFEQQHNILKSTKDRFESSLFDIQQLVQADIFDSEIDTAHELLKNKFVRAAGAVAGVVLEKHLGQVCINHNMSINKKNPTINDFNELLKNNNVLDTPAWRFIQHLGDLRNLCDHNKEKEPTKEEVTDLVNGVSKITKTLF